MTKGSVTVFLSLIIPIIIIFVLTVLESVRAEGIKAQVIRKGNAAMDSLLAEYNLELLQEYGLLFYNCNGVSVDKDAIESSYETMFLNDDEYSEVVGGLFQLQDCDAELQRVLTATDMGGEIFVKNVLDYFGAEISGELLNQLSQEQDLFQTGENGSTGMDLESSTLNQTDWATLFEKRNNQSESKKSGINNGRKTDEEVNRDSLSVDKGSARRLDPDNPPPKRKLSETDSTENEIEDSEEEVILFDQLRYDRTINQSPIGAAEQVEARGWLSLVIPEGQTISGVRMETKDFPSITEMGKSEQENGIMNNALYKAAVNEYFLRHFSNFMSEREKENVQYEIEYLIAGKDNDYDNFKSVLTRIMLIREGLNLITLYSSSSMREEANLLAAAMVSWCGLPELIPAVEAALLISWAYAESIADVRALLSGKKVELLKTEETWTVKLMNAGSFLNGSQTDYVESETGMSYTDYLRAFLFMSDFQKNVYRCMDMIQLNMRSYDAAFLMNSQIYGLEIMTSAIAEPLFTGLPIVRREVAGFVSEYRFESVVSGTY